jgi:hypothetical protein
MDKNLRLCIDRFIDKPFSYTSTGRKALFSSAEPARAFLLTAKRWPTSKLRISFLEGTSEQKDLVKQYANEWTKVANLKFLFDDSDPHIRITFNENLGSWSYLGVDALSREAQDPTMNLGWILPQVSELEKKNTIIHEFGHAIGLLHEHQHPQGGIQWNKTRVYADMAQPPNEWSPEQVDHNLFRRYDEDITAFSKFDPKSVMIYPIPKEWTTDGKGYGFDVDGISQSDEHLIKNMYPST